MGMQTFKLLIGIGLNVLSLGLMTQTGQSTTGVTYLASETVPQGAIALPDNSQPHAPSNVKVIEEVYVASEEMVPGAIFLEKGRPPAQAVGSVPASLPSQVPTAVPPQVPIQQNSIESSTQVVPEEQKRQLSIPTLAPEIDDQGQLIDNTTVDISDPTQIIDVKGKAKEVTSTSDFVVPTRIIIPHIANPQNDVLPIPVQSKILSAVELNSEAIQPFEPKPDPVEYGDLPTCPVSFDADAETEQRQAEQAKQAEIQKSQKKKHNKKSKKKKKKIEEVVEEANQSDDDPQTEDEKPKEKKKKKKGKKKTKKKNKAKEEADTSEEE